MNLKETFTAVQAASRKLALLDDQTINRILNAVADAAIAETPFILSENAKDLARMEQSNPKYDRLKLTEARLKGIAADTRNVATLPSPLGRVNRPPQWNETDKGLCPVRCHRHHL